LLAKQAHGIGSLLLDTAGVANGASDTARDHQCPHGHGHDQQADGDADHQLDQRHAALGVWCLVQAVIAWGTCG